MLQNNSAVTLQYDSDLRIAQQNRVEPICKTFIINLFNLFEILIASHISYICVTDYILSV